MSSTCSGPTYCPRTPGPAPPTTTPSWSSVWSGRSSPSYDPARPYADDPERGADAWVRATAVEHDPDGGWQLHLVDAERAFSVAVGDTAARRHTEVKDGQGGTLAVEAMGGWADPETFRAELILLETAHRVEVTLSAAGSHATWRSVPLRSTSLLGLATR